MNEKQADTLLNVPEIVKRAKIALNLKRDSELASYLGVARATRKRKSAARPEVF